MKREHLLYAAAIGALVAARAARADACTLHATVQIVTYWDGSSTYNPAGSNDLRCNQNKDGTQTCQLQGYYIAPIGGGSTAVPTVVFIHGSGSTMPGSYCDTLNAFIDQGYQVMVPVMRGVAGSATDSTGTHTFPTNTGQYVVDWADAHKTSSCDVGCASLDYMNRESRDIDSAIHWLVDKHPNRTDLTHWALVGHSYGGATVMVAQASTSNLTFAPTVTVDLSGAGMSWSPGSGWEDGLNAAADHFRAPIYFQRVVNESPIAPDIGSALEPYDHVVWGGGSARLAAYSFYTPTNSTMCNDTTPNWHNVHCTFVMTSDGVSVWKDGVIEFLHDHGM